MTIDARREIGLGRVADESADIGTTLDELFDDLVD